MDAPRVFKLSADHVALDFINTLDDRFAPGLQVDKLESYQDLLSFAQQSSVLTAAQAASLSRLAKTGNAVSALGEALESRELLALIFYSLADGQRVAGREMQAFNERLHEASKHRIISEHAGNFEWRWKNLDKHLEAPLWPIIQAAADLLTSANVQFVRACARESCRWLFLDVSKNHSRRWCDMKVCGNRVKARRYYAQHGQD